MYDYLEQVSLFLRENFTPADDNKANVKHTTKSLLAFLFRLFPEDCITDYNLNDILLEQGYKRVTFVEEQTIRCENDEGDEFFEIRKSLAIGWCMRTDHNLSTETISSPNL